MDGWMDGLFDGICHVCVLCIRVILYLCFQCMYVCMYVQYVRHDPFVFDAYNNSLSIYISIYHNRCHIC